MSARVETDHLLALFQLHLGHRPFRAEVLGKWFQKLDLRFLIVGLHVLSPVECHLAFFEHTFHTFLDFEHVNGGLVAAARQQVQAWVKFQLIDLSPTSPSPQLLKLFASLNRRNPNDSAILTCRCQQGAIGVDGHHPHSLVMHSNRVVLDVSILMYDDSEHAYFGVWGHDNSTHLILRHSTRSMWVVMSLTLVYTLHTVEIEHVGFVLQDDHQHLFDQLQVDDGRVEGDLSAGSLLEVVPDDYLLQILGVYQCNEV